MRKLLAGSILLIVAGCALFGVAVAQVLAHDALKAAISAPPKKATYNTYEAQSVNYADAGESAVSEVSCPAGEVVVSGSADITGPASGQHQQALDHGHAWSASVDAGSEVTGVKAHVICAKGTEEEHDEAP